ncbi:unnamed protein product [Schistocephalus solidus]|uniref:Lymphoid-specific helicase n=1 Tax=Schistocephalus solidus TaxID=70667 RepID=A0A3P7C3C3_SCHSO|nr:unnamed protein product [Schistocephalus solidus]
MRQYQQQGVQWIISLYENGLNGILADEMGLGKTAQILTSFAALVAGGAKGPFLVVAPLSVLHSWAEQMDIFAPSLPRLIYYGTNEERIALREQITRIQCFTEAESTAQGHHEEKKNNIEEKSRNRTNKACSFTERKVDRYPHLQSLISEVLAKPSPRDVPFSKQRSSLLPVTPPIQHSQFPEKPIVTAGGSYRRADDSASVNVNWRAGMLSIMNFPFNQPSIVEPELTHLTEILNSVISQSSYNIKKDYQNFIAKADQTDIYFQSIHSSQPPNSPPENATLRMKRQKKRRLPVKPSEECALKTSKNVNVIQTGMPFGERGSEENASFLSAGYSQQQDTPNAVKPLQSHRLEKAYSDEVWGHLEDVINAVLSPTDDDNELEVGAPAQNVSTTFSESYVAENGETQGATIVTESGGSTLGTDLKTAYPPRYLCPDGVREDKSSEKLPFQLRCEHYLRPTPVKPEALPSDACEGGARHKDMLTCPPPTGASTTNTLSPTVELPSPSLQAKSVDSITARRSPGLKQEPLFTKCLLLALDREAHNPPLPPACVNDAKENGRKTRVFECHAGDATNNPCYFLSDCSEGKNQNKCLSSHKDPNVHFAEKQFVSVWELKGSSKAESPNLSFKVDKSFSSSPSRQLGASHQAEECAISGSSQQLKCDGQSESDLSFKVKELMSTAEQSVVTTDDSGIDLPQTLNQCRGELSSDKKALEVHREFVSVSAPQHEPFFLNRIADTSDVKNSNMPHSAESGSFPVVLTTYEVAIRDSSFLERINFKVILFNVLHTKLLSTYFQALVVDEAQRIKRASSKLFQCLKGFDADIRLVVTGTPLQNNISELWSLLHFILPEIFSLGTDFSVWFDPIGLVEQVGRDRLAAQEAEHALVTNLRKVIRPFMLRRTKSEAKVFLPPKREVVLRVNLAPIQKTLYDFVTDTLRNEGILFVPKKQPGGSITMLDKRNILPQSRRNAPGTLAKENFRVSSSDEKSKIEAEVKSQPKRRVGRPRKINPPNAPADVDSGAYSSSAVNSDVEKFLPKVADPQDNPYDFEFLPEVMRSNRLMLLRRIVNHPYLAIEPPKEFYSTPSPQRNSSQEGEDDEAVSSNRLELLLSASGKMRLLDKLLQELLADGHKGLPQELRQLLLVIPLKSTSTVLPILSPQTLIFSQFTMALDMIEELLKFRKWEWVRLDGAMRFETRQTAVHRFNTTTAAELPIFLLSTRAGGLGLNLQAAADTVIIHDSDWNPQLDLQAQDRFVIPCHRIGQEKPVLVLRLVSAGTIEEAIYARALAKRGLERLLLYKNTTLTGSTDFLELDGSISDEFDSVPMANKSTFKINQASGKGLSANESSGSKDAFDLMQLLDAPEQATEPTIDAETISDAELKRILSREFDDQQIPNASEDNTGANVLEPRKSLPSGDSPELTTHGMAELCANNSNGRAFPESEAKAKVTNLNCYSDRRRRISAKLATDPGTRSRSSRKLTCKSPIAKEYIHSAKRSRVHRSPESQISPDSSSLARGSESTRVDSISDLVQESQKMVVFSACSDAKNPPAQLLRRSSRSPVTHLLGFSGVNSFASSDDTEPAAAAVGRKSITRPASRRWLPNQPHNVTSVSQRLLRSGMTLRQASENPCSSTSIVEVVKTTKAPLRHTFPRQVLPLKSSATADLKKSGNCDLAPRCSRISQLSTGEHNTVSQVSMSTGLRHCTGLSRSFKSLEDRTILFSKFKPPALRCNQKKGPLLLPKPKLLADEVEE